MNVTVQDFQEVALIAGGVAVGTAAGNLAITKAPAKIKKFAPAGVVLLGFGAMVAVDHPAVTGLGAGMISVGVSGLVTQFTKPEEGAVNGLKDVVRNAFPTVGMAEVDYEIPALSLDAFDDDFAEEMSIPQNTVQGIDLSKLM